MQDILASILFIIFFVWSSYFLQGDRDYSTQTQAIANITYRYTQTAGKKGELTEAIYNDLENSINYYGDYKITLIAERYEEDNTVTKLEGTNIVGYDLRENDFDILTIYVEGERQHWLGSVQRLLSGADADYKIVSKSSVFVQ